MPINTNEHASLTSIGLGSPYEDSESLCVLCIRCAVIVLTDYLREVNSLKGASVAAAEAEEEADGDEWRRW